MNTSLFAKYVFLLHGQFYPQNSISDISVFYLHALKNMSVYSSLHVFFLRIMYVGMCVLSMAILKGDIRRRMMFYWAEFIDTRNACCNLYNEADHIQ